MRPVIVATGDLTDGFRLAGIPVFEVSGDQDLEAIEQGIRAIEDAGLILVDERYMDYFEEAFREEELPMIASFPAEEVARDQTYIDELTLRFLGQKLHID